MADQIELDIDAKVIADELRAIGPIAKGAFHRWLGKKEDEPITAADIAKGLASDDPHVKKMAQFAENAKSFNSADPLMVGDDVDERQHEEPDADDSGGPSDNDADDQTSDNCPTCEGLGTVNGEPCPNVEAHMQSESVGGQEQVSASPDVELRKQKHGMLNGSLECRDFQADVELRQTSNGKLKLTGYASVTETPYDVMDFTETIARGAFKRTLADKAHVVLLINHEGLPLASTESGTMTLSEDVRGLRVDAELEPSDPDVQRLAPKMERKDLKEMSFAFRATRQKWNEPETERLIEEVSIHRGDVSMVTHGANSATGASLAMRSADNPPEAPQTAPKPLRRSNVEWAKGRRAKLRRSR